MMEIFFDESGNSGPNLLDHGQPVFVLASHNYSKDEAAIILQPLISIVNSHELHFKNLKKYEKSRQAVIKCLNSNLITKGRTYHYISLKDFMIAIQMVDRLIEPVLYERGIDIYKGGANISTSNLIYIFAKNVWVDKGYEDMSVKFVKWIRDPDKETRREFYEAAEKLLGNINEETERMLIGFILLSRSMAEQIEAGLDKYTLDATISMFNAHCQQWAKIIQQPFDVKFDNSKQIEYWRDLINYLSNRLPPQEVGFGSRKYKYPLLINGLELLDSKNNLQIQLADLFASSLNYAYTNHARGQHDNFSNAILESTLASCERNSMWPDKRMTAEELDMEDETGINVLDYLVSQANSDMPAFKKAYKMTK